MTVRLRTLVLVTTSGLALACGGDDGPSDRGAGGAAAGAGGSAAGQGGTGQSGGAAGASGAGAFGPGANPYPDPGDFEPNLGPGGPATTFGDQDLYVNCAFLDGGPLDTTDHHNLVVMLDGYLLMPWAPESGGGGLSFFEFDDPCNPTRISTGYSDKMRETHSIGFSSVAGRRYAVVDEISARDTQGAGGIQFWDVTDPMAPAPVSELELPSFFYPDAYARVVLSVFWQGDYVYAAAGDSGLAIVDASDPAAPRLVDVYTWNPLLRAGQVQAVGNLLMVTPASFGRTVLLDISDPESPQPIPEGEYFAGGAGLHYFSNFANGFIYYTRNALAGGLIVYDVRDPEKPTLVGDVFAPGAGGYVFVKDNLAFTGQSDYFNIYDVTDHGNMTEVAKLGLQGDQDTATPIGNVVVLSVDDDAPPEGGTAVAPWSTTVDVTPPRVTWMWPADGATNVPTGSRIGLSFSEFVDVKSAWAGSIRLYQRGTAPGDTRVDVDINTQESIVNLSPDTPLLPNTEYTVEVPAGGVTDYNGNAVETTFKGTFTTGG